MTLAHRVGNKLVMIEPSTLPKDGNPWNAVRGRFPGLEELRSGTALPFGWALAEVALFLRRGCRSPSVKTWIGFTLARWCRDVQDELLLTAGSILRQGRGWRGTVRGVGALLVARGCCSNRIPGGDLLVRLNRWLLEDGFRRALWPSSFGDFENDDVREDLGFLITSQWVLFATNEDHEASLARLVEALALPRRTRRR